MSALPKTTLRSLVENRPNRYPDIMDEIPRTYEPDFRTLPHYPEGKPRPGLPGIFDDLEGMPRGLPGQKTQTYEECQRRYLMSGRNSLMDPCRGLPHGDFKLPRIDPDFYPDNPGKLPNIDPDFERYGPGAIMETQPSVGQGLGKLAGMFLGQFIQDRLGGR